jgi:hypothetical protein
LDLTVLIHQPLLLLQQVAAQVLVVQQEHQAVVLVVVVLIALVTNLVQVEHLDKVTLVAAETTLVNSVAVVAVRAPLAHVTVAAVALGLMVQLMQVAAEPVAMVLLRAAAVLAAVGKAVALILVHQ